MRFNKNRQTPDSANTGTAVAEKPETPFVDGRRSLTVTKTMKARGKGNKEDDKGVDKDVTYIEVNSLGAAVAAILDTVGNDEKAALEVVNSALERAATQKVYDETFGDEIKIRAMIRANVAAGLPEALAEKIARDAFAQAKGGAE